MELKNIIFTIVFLSAFGFLAFSLNRVIGYLKLGQKENRFDNISSRIKNVLKIAFAQSKLLRDPVAGSVHFIIFWGFMLFISAVIEAIIQGFYSPFTFEFLGPFFSVITIVQDLFGVLVVLSVLFALYRRFIQKINHSNISGEKNCMNIYSLI